MNTWIRVGLMAVLVALLLALFGGDARDAAVLLGVIGLVLLVVGLAVGGWKTSPRDV